MFRVLARGEAEEPNALTRANIGGIAEGYIEGLEGDLDGLLQQLGVDPLTISGPRNAPPTSSTRYSSLPPIPPSSQGVAPQYERAYLRILQMEAYIDACPGAPPLHAELVKDQFNLLVSLEEEAEDEATKAEFRAISARYRAEIEQSVSATVETSGAHPLKCIPGYWRTASSHIDFVPSPSQSRG